MKVLHLSTHDLDGGAARAAYRLHQGLKAIGLNSQMLVQQKTSDDLSVLGPEVRLNQGLARTKATLDVLPLKPFYPKRDKSVAFSVQWLPDRVFSTVTQQKPDIINLHWIGGGFTQIETLKQLKRPLVWTLHDMWAFTGGCHYSGDCDRYLDACGRCPQLYSTQERDLSRWIWRRKANAWQNLDLTIVTPSAWLAKCVNHSSLFQSLPIEHIPSGLDTKVYRPIDKAVARQILQLPLEKRLILFGALRATRDQRKGFHLLQPALQRLSQIGWQNDPELVPELVIVGASQPLEPIDLGFKTHYLGTLKDETSLALTYSCADLFVLPSTEDNLPNVIVEAFACGVPCIGFNIGGLPDLIEHQENGYLAKPFEVEDLAKGMAWILEDKERQQKLSYRAREKVEQQFALDISARRYSSLYSKLLEQPSRR
jgi:glycosyltransferase involved in cell wall biosynthesis